MGIYAIKLGIFSYILEHEEKAIKQINESYISPPNLQELISKGENLLKSLPEENLDNIDTRNIIIVGGIIKKTFAYNYFTLDNNLFVGFLSKAFN